MTRIATAAFGLVGLVAVVSLGCSDAATFGTQRSNPAGGGALTPTASSDAGGVGLEPTPTAQPSVAPVAPIPTIDEVGDVYLEPACPEAMQRVESSQCDPLGEQSQCAEGQGCFPYVEYPKQRCAPETFGSRCQAQGTGVQGDPCSGQLCAHGFLCVVNARGTECAQLCRVPGENTCPPGFICGSLDIDGFGVCI